MDSFCRKLRRKARSETRCSSRKRTDCGGAGETARGLGDITGVCGVERRGESMDCRGELPVVNDGCEALREWLLLWLEPPVHDDKYDRKPPPLLGSLGGSTVPVSCVETESTLSESSSSLPL